MEVEYAMLMVQSRRLERHHSDSSGELTEDGILRTARLSGTRKRRAIRIQQAPNKKTRNKLEAAGLDRGTPSTLLMKSTLDTNASQRPNYRMANYLSIRARYKPHIEMRPITEWEVSEIQRGWLVVNQNAEYNETWLRYHASKKHGKSDHKCSIQNQTLAVILEIDDTAKAKPYGTDECGTMQIRTIGEENPVDGWGTINYFHVLCHRGDPLFAPQTASDDFWRNVVTNLGEYQNRIGQYYNEQLKKYVHLPYPGPPPLTEPSAPAAQSSQLQRASSWEWPPQYEEGGGSASSSRWQGDRYGSGQRQGRQWQAHDWRDQPRYDPYNMYQ